MRVSGRVHPHRMTFCRLPARDHRGVRDAIADVLPFTAGMILTPFAVIAVVVLLVTDGGIRKAVAFAVGFALVSFLVCLGLAQLVGGRAGGEPGEPPDWARTVAVALGVLLLMLAFMQLRFALRHHRDATVRKPPAWIAAADHTSVRKSASLGAALDLNPVNVSMMLAAAATLGAYELPLGRDIAVSAIFATISSTGILAPLLIAVLPGLREKVSLQDVRQWLVDHGATISFVTTLIFAVLFLGKGLRGG